ncbi:MAG: RHS repeat-associated core domain-containing protein [Candidatus Hodarchaeota archaeon]
MFLKNNCNLAFNKDAIEKPILINNSSIYSRGGAPQEIINHKAGRRVEKNVDGYKTRYIYDGDNVIAEYDGNGNLTRKYIHGARVDELVCMIDVTDNNAVYYYHYDALGSVVALSDSSGDSCQSYEYSVFGQVAASDPDFKANPYMFTGRRFDYETGLYYYRARYYNPYIGRFLQTDPVGYGDGINWYAYCGNNPLAFVDPTGRWAAIEEMLSEELYDALNDSNDSNDSNDLLLHWGYDTMDEAARAALAMAQEATNSESVLKWRKEYGGHIYKYKGKYGFTDPQEGYLDAMPPEAVKASEGLIPSEAKSVGFYHSHPWVPMSHGNPEVFSGMEYQDWMRISVLLLKPRGDIPFFIGNKLNGYVITPKGKQLKFDYKSRDITSLN